MKPIFLRHKPAYLKVIEAILRNSFTVKRFYPSLIGKESGIVFTSAYAHMKTLERMGVIVKLDTNSKHIGYYALNKDWVDKLDNFVGFYNEFIKESRRTE